MATREARDPARADLAAVGDEAPQGAQVLVVDPLDVDPGVLARPEAVRATRPPAPSTGRAGAPHRRALAASHQARARL